MIRGGRQLFFNILAISARAAVFIQAGINASFGVGFLVSLLMLTL